MVKNQFLSALTFIILVFQCSAELCYGSHNVLFDETYSLDCSQGCCGSYHAQECCSLSHGAIIGIAFGTFIAFVLIVALIICIVYTNRSGQDGTVMQHCQNVSVVSSTNQAATCTVQSENNQNNLDTTIDSPGAVQYNTGFAKLQPPFEEPS